MPAVRTERWRRQPGRHASAAPAVQPVRRLSGLFAKAWWPWARCGVVAAFLIGVLVLLVTLGRDVDWAAVGSAVRETTPSTLALAAAFALASHGVYSSFDLIGRCLTGHGLSAGRSALVCWVSYVFNLNFGSMVGGVGFRIRLYTRMGLDAEDIAVVFATSLLTNWLGVFLLAGGSLLWQPFDLPADWLIGTAGLRALGLVLAALALAYVGLCAFATQRVWRVRGHGLPLPTLRMALLQCAMSMLHWACIAAAIHVLLGMQLPYASVLGTLLLSAGTGLIVRVPAGLGVLEAVFIGLLSPAVPQLVLLASLLSYRALYFLLPLLPALVAYGVMELGLRRTGSGRTTTPVCAA